jgi:hypothetical protein
VILSHVDANVGYWQVTAGFLKLDYWDYIYVYEMCLMFG